jgi:phosphatidylglycerophosphatase A
MKRVHRRRHTFFRPAPLLATWFGVGCLPGAPGTFGSLAALPFAWAIAHFLGPLALGIGIALVFLVGIWAADRYARQHGIVDPGAVVIDEVAGQWLTVLVVPPDPALYAIGFGLFRAFDVIKPWPISLIDRKIKGGFGIMLDDLLAGALAAILLWNVWIWSNW